ncbi:MAG TPA: glutamate--tRNA ligase family protein [Vicinamibacterales bacterium]|nr:glutamate--tRNA ligase family protein [Vicinamibacterales bacterium]
MIVSRFAPAPTGYLHLGHVVNALHVWGVTRAVGGRVLLRIEDHDRQRSRDHYERAILDDLDWLGFVPDEPSTASFRAGPTRGRQRDRQDVYERALQQLRAQDLLYACACTRRDLREAAPSPIAGGESESELRYTGRCSNLDLDWRPGLGIRLRVADAVERFDDLCHGVQTQRPREQCGDLLVRDREGNWTYQFAVAVDDLEQGITLVVRGDDLLSSTGRQIQLARLLGRATPPAFFHHRLIMKSATQKLSKADGATGVRDMRHAGLSAAAVVGQALCAAGFTDTPAPMRREAAEQLVAERYVEAVQRLRRSG